MNKLKKLFKHSPEPEQSHSTPATTSTSSTPSHTTTSSTPRAAQMPSSAATPASSVPSRPAVGSRSSSSSASSVGGAAAASSELPMGVLLTTNYGDITIALFSKQTPKTCRNFAGLADSGRYNNVIFHRIIANFMIQGGDPTGTGRGGESIYGGKFEDEFDNSLVHSGRGILSMANSGKNTNGSQFFITLGPTPHLDGKHTVFGQVVAGMDVIDRIGAARTDAGDRPLEDIKIIKAQSFS